MTDKTAALTTKQHWANVWRKTNLKAVEFNPRRFQFRELDTLLKRHLPKSSNLTLLEIGCYPGRYMWYFNRFFGYKVSGIEYIQQLCEPIREQLRRCGIDAEIIHADILSYQPLEDHQWDVVVSLGLIEHFSNPEEIIRKHLTLLKTGGYLILVVPNHAGINGKILKTIHPEKYAMHNRISYEDMKDAVEKTGLAQVLQGGYFGRLGFWNTGLYARLSDINRLLYISGRLLLWPIEALGRFVPNSKLLSPNAAIIAKKR